MAWGCFLFGPGRAYTACSLSDQCMRPFPVQPELVVRLRLSAARELGPVATETRLPIWVKMRKALYEQMLSELHLPAQPVDATQALNLSAAGANCKVSHGRSFIRRPTLFR